VFVWKRFAFSIKNTVIKFASKDTIVDIQLTYAGATFYGWNTRTKSKGQSSNGEIKKLSNSLNKICFYILQGDIIHQENVELYRKVNLNCQENMKLKKKVLVCMAIETKIISN